MARIAGDPDLEELRRPERREAGVAVERDAALARELLVKRAAPPEEAH